MKSDEKYIESRFGKTTPFAVPDGYFDNLAQSIMDKVDDTVVQTAGAEPFVVEKPLSQKSEVKMPTWWNRSRRYVAAACAALLVSGLSAYFACHPIGGGNDMHSVAAHVGNAGCQVQGSTYDYEMEYTMLDNEDMYSLMASN